MAKNTPKSMKPSTAKRQKASSRRKTKKETCIARLERPEGASLAELQKATGWQPHSVRGFLSGTVKKLEGVRLNSEVTDEGERRYCIETGKAS